ncbi:unnamed protein product [Trichobilharzia szidati]|nr:unnamed protein product [Trichobilharzia szidati]
MSPKRVKKSELRTEHLLRLASKCDLPVIAQLVNYLRQKMVDFGFIEDKRHLRDSMDVDWLDDKTLQLKLDFEDAYHIWSVRGTEASSERYQNLHRKLLERYSHLHSKWEEKIKLCNHSEISAVKSKLSEDNKAAYKELLQKLKDDDSCDPASSCNASSSSTSHAHQQTGRTLPRISCYIPYK